MIALRFIVLTTMLLPVIEVTALPKDIPATPFTPDAGIPPCNSTLTGNYVCGKSSEKPAIGVCTIATAKGYIFVDICNHPNESTCSTDFPDHQPRCVFKVKAGP